MKQLMTGDEAVARGAWEAGVRFAAAYPGTPSTEILENLAAYPEVRAEWATNEKVALESAIGAAIAGGRSIASMKHVGMNVAADPLMTWAYMGVNAGNVIVTADEPGMFSSQNEQDNRNYAKFAKIPMLEPSDSQECKDMTALAFELSERFNTPVILRMTTRICHSKSIVETGERKEAALKGWEPDIQKYVCVPAVARKLRVKLEERLGVLREYSETTELNRCEMHDVPVGVIASGVCYQYAREVFGDNVSYLKLGFTYPLPMDKIDAFCEEICQQAEKAGQEPLIYVIEENDPYLEEAVCLLGYDCFGKDLFPVTGELTPDVIRSCVTDEPQPAVDFDRDKLISRPPSLCAGCPHRGFFYTLGKRKNVMVAGDIGCYTLASGKPYKALHSALCMGASLSMGHGAQTVFNMGDSGKRVVAVLGDSTFFHTGINSLINTIYNGSNTVSVILDNRITGMTGHQDNPGTGFTAQGEPTNLIDLETLVKAVGFKHVRVIDPNDLAAVNAVLDEFLALDEPSVIITRYPCVLKKFSQKDLAEFEDLYKTKCAVDAEKCIGCHACVRTGCPALSVEKDGKKVRIDSYTCVGCKVCAQVCPVNAIGVKED